MHVLLAHASVHGSSAEIAEYMAGVLKNHGFLPTVAHVDQIEDLALYDAVILGAPIHTGMWVKPMMLFVQRYQAQLRQKPFAAWLTCIRVLEENGMNHVKDEYVMPDLAQFRLLVPMGVFAGKLDMKTVSSTERWLLNARYDGQHVIDHMTGDFRNWSAIHQWTMSVVEVLVQQRQRQQV